MAEPPPPTPGSASRARWPRSATGATPIEPKHRRRNGQPSMLEAGERPNCGRLTTTLWTSDNHQMGDLQTSDV